MSARVLLLAFALPGLALAKPKPTLAYKAPPSDPDDRPVATAITVGTQGNDFAFKIVFDKVPWGEACGNRCANATLFLDTDGAKATGLQLPEKNAAATGADLAVTIQGAREYKESSADALLRVTVRGYGDDKVSIDDGDTLAELDHRRDPERVHVEDKTVYLLVDPTLGNLPSGAKVRVVYQPPDSKPLVATIRGMLATGGRGKVEIFKPGKRGN